MKHEGPLRRAWQHLVHAIASFCIFLVIACPAVLIDVVLREYGREVDPVIVTVLHVAAYAELFVSLWLYIRFLCQAVRQHDGQPVPPLPLEPFWPGTMGAAREAATRTLASIWKSRLGQLLIAAAVFTMIGLASISVWYWYREGEVHGHVVDSATSIPVDQALVKTVGGLESDATMTTPTGQFSLKFYKEAKLVNLVVDHDYYHPLEKEVAVTRPSIVERLLGHTVTDIVIRLDRYAVSGTIRDARTQLPIADARVSVGTSAFSIATSDGSGRFTLPVSNRMSPGDSIVFAVEKSGYETKSKTVPFTRDSPYTIELVAKTDRVQVQLRPVPKSVDQDKRDQWDLVKQKIAAAQAAAVGADYGRAFEFYKDAWNNIPETNSRGDNVLQEEVDIAWSDYGEGKFKSASDRFARVLRAIKIPAEKELYESAK